MSRPVITVENLSKAYRIGLKEEIPDTLVAAMSGLMKAPFRKFRDLRKLDTFGHSGGEEEDLYWALKDVSFEVQEGEVLGVIGRNGAGKSTLLKILSRITEPTRGRAVIRGRVSSLLEVGTGFHPELSGRENVYLNGTILGMTKREIDRKFDEIVDFSGVEKFLDTPIKRYSSGMKVRLAFAVAAHLEPEILIIDEVLAVGDAEFQKKCIGKMQDVARGGRTVLFVSHSMPAIRRLCTDAIILSKGRSSAMLGVEEAIRTYSAERPRNELVWQNPDSAPGDEVVRLHSIRVVRAIDSSEQEVLWIEEPFSIEVEYDVLKGGSSPTPNLHFFTDDGTYAFVSHDTDSRWIGAKKQVGRYVSVCRVPAFFMNTGSMTIGVALTTYHPFHVHCFERESIQLTFDEADRASQFRAGYGGPIPGVIRPVLAWETDCDVVSRGTNEQGYE